MDIEQVIERYHGTLGEFSRGAPGGVKALYSRADDITLANPFGPAVRGWPKVSAALDYASSRFRDGDVTVAEQIALYATDALATMLEVEHWRARVGDRAEVEPWVLRVSSTFRREGDGWRLVHRHADPIATADAEGPLRGS